jgi:eukaryotic-like serine/threonine-protein kinase
MRPQHWQKVKQIFQSVLEYPPGERAAFLDEACASDPTLRSEVESLISSHDQAGDSIEARRKNRLWNGSKKLLKAAIFI